MTTNNAEWRDAVVTAFVSNRAFWLFAVFLMVSAVGVFFVPLDPFPHHEGEVLYPALMLNHGLEPVRDVLYVHPPTTAYLYALFFRVFGETLIVSRIVTLAGISTLAVLMTLLGSRFLPTGVAAAFAFLYSVMSRLLWDLVTRPWPTLWGLIFVLSACLLVMNWTARLDKHLYLILAGLMIGIAAIFRLNLGFYALVALMTAAVFVVHDVSHEEVPVKRLRAIVLVIVRIGVPAAAVVAGSFAFFVYRWGGLPTLWHLLQFQASEPAVMTARFGQSWSLRESLALDRSGITAAMLYIAGPVFLFRAMVSPTTSAWLGRAAVAGVILCLWAFGVTPMLRLGPAVLAVAGWDLWRDRIYPSRESRYAYLLLTMTALASWGIMYPGGDPRYLAWAGCALALLIAFRLHLQCQLAEPDRREVAILLASAIAVVLLGPSHLAELRATLRHTERMTLNDGFYRGMKPTLAHGQEYVALKHYVDAYTGRQDCVLIWKGDLLHYAYLDRRSPLLPYASLDILVYLSPRGKMIEDELLGRLEKAPPAIVILDPTRSDERSWDISATLYAGSFPKLQHYIDQNYHQVWRSPLGDYIVLKSNSLQRSCQA